MTHPIMIICEDPIIHTDEHPYCDDPTCPCHEEEAAEDGYINLAARSVADDEAGTHPCDCRCAW